MNFWRMQRLFSQRAVRSQKKRKMKYIAIRTNDGESTGRIRFYCEALEVSRQPFRLIQHPARGSCLYRCGNERYLLQVRAPEYKEKLFGQTGGR